MVDTTGTLTKSPRIDRSTLSPGEAQELKSLGMLAEDGSVQEYRIPDVHRTRPPIEKHAVSAPEMLNEAFDYTRPSSFSRALTMQLGQFKVLLISGTASVDDEGYSVHEGDFRAQCWRTYGNITALLEAEGMTWHDIVRTTCYLRDIERDYKDFNEIRTAFFEWLGLDPLPASTGIQTRLCREDLLVEIEAIAIARLEEGTQP
jgi:enamine deaminase RidA (YjgF/YER057c/UK114 family)